MGATHFSGPVISPGGFQGPISGAVTNATVTATASVAGLVKQAASQPAAAGANPTKAEYDALIAALKTAGVMVSP